ncbi:hypothetical protein [Salirhabdus sp. Marseille-P4669]|nr:hypothetical protein [Salirhabdus sp. Marseille-P4669]
MMTSLIIVSATVFVTMVTLSFVEKVRRAFSKKKEFLNDYRPGGVALQRK